MSNARSALILLLVALAPATVASGNDADRSSIAAIRDRDWTRADAAHLLRRAGFGGSPAEADKLYALGPEAAVDYLLDYQHIPFAPAGPAVDALAGDRPDQRELRALSEDERRRFQQKRRAADRRTFEEVRAWWLERMVTSPRSLEEKMTLFWHGHFTSGMREVRNSVFMLEQNELLRRLALGNFRDLLIQVSRDRAMLLYLDGARNNKRQPNENYARELLELFTLGVGNYTESDIKAAARAFTGWSMDTDGYRFRPLLHDNGVKTFLGRTGNLGGEDVIDIILQQKACAEFLARNLIEFFVRPDADPELVRRLAAIIRRENYELKPIMRTLLLSRAFYHEDSRGSLIKSPAELLVGAARQFQLPLHDLVLAERALAAMGQELMQPPNVKGWDGDQKWINTATLFNRYNTVAVLLDGDLERRLGRRLRERLARNDEGAARSGMQSMRSSTDGEPESRSRLVAQGAQPAYDPLPTLQARELATAEQVVDYFVEALLAEPLASQKREYLIAYLLGDDQKFSLGDKDARQRVRTMVALLCSTPEYQLN